MSLERLYPEQHDTLADIPEPAESTFLSGHAEEFAGLADAYRRGKLPHALVVAGPRGIGKATLAFHLARHILAHPDAAKAPAEPTATDPGGQLYRLVAQGAHPSVLHLTRPPVERGTGFKQALTVDEIRRVNRFLGMTAPDGGYRVVIVDPADDMNVNAANALLKRLEEPPQRTLFLLLSHMPGRLLPTIRSRSQIIRLRPLDDEALAGVLDRVGCEMPPDDEARRLLFARAGGSAREAITLQRHGGLDTVRGIRELVAQPGFPVPLAYRMADAVAARGEGGRFDAFNQMLLDEIARQALDSAASGGIERAARLSAFWQEASAAIGAATTFNLDKRQHVVGMLRRLHEAVSQR